MHPTVPASPFAPLAALFAALFAATWPGTAFAHSPAFTSDLDPGACTFTTTGSHPYFPLWPGYAVQLDGEEEDDGETVAVSARITVLPDVQLVAGVATRVVEERESEDGELVEVSRNYFAICRETGDVWYFGEDVDDYEDGVIVGHGGVWRAGVAGARAGIMMPGTPFLGARYYQEQAPGVALDRGEIVGRGGQRTTPAGTFDHVLTILDTNELGSGSGDLKVYAPGVGLIVDEALELTEIVLPPCLPDATTLCLNDGRFKVEARWQRTNGTEGDANANQVTAEAGELWFFRESNTELFVRVFDGCGQPSPAYWVYSAGLTRLGVTLTVTDTQSGQVRTYENAVGHAYTPILDSAAFATCP